MKRGRKVIAGMLVGAMLLGHCDTAAQAAAKVKLAKKSITLQKGKSTTLRLKNCKTKVKWSINKKKVAKLTAKSKNTVKIQAKKAGTAKITARAGGKKYICKLTVKTKGNGGTQTTKAPGENTQAPGTSPAQPGSTSPAGGGSTVSGGSITAPGASSAGGGTSPAETLSPEDAKSLILEAESTDSSVQGISVYKKGNIKLVEVFGGFEDIREVFPTITFTLHGDGTRILSQDYSPEAYFSDRTPGYYRIEVKGVLDGEEVSQTYFLGRAGAYNYTEKEDGSVELGKYAGWTERLAIPEKLDGKTVTGLNQSFYECKELKEISIPSSVTSIGDRAFRLCGNLTEVNIPSSVTSIGAGAFEVCRNLTEVNIPSSVTSIGNDAFYASSLTEVNIPSSVTNIGSGAFKECSFLTTLTVSEGNQRYDSRSGCNAIIETETNTLIAGCNGTEIPSSVTSIRDGAFWGSGIVKISIPSNIVSIGSSAFSYSHLTEVDISSGVTSIGAGAFLCCMSLTKVIIPSSVTDMGDNVFGFYSHPTLYVVRGSYAHAYAQTNYLKYVLLESDGSSPVPTASPESSLMPGLTPASPLPSASGIPSSTPENSSSPIPSIMSLSTPGTQVPYVSPPISVSPAPTASPVPSVSSVPTVSPVPSASPMPTVSPQAEKNAEDAGALAELIQAQRETGAALPDDLNAECYMWNEDGRLEKINWRGCGLSGELAISGFPALVELDCSENELTSLDVSRIDKLANLWCDENQLTQLDLSRNQKLVELYCERNHLAELDVSNHTMLETLHCSANQMERLNVSGCTVLRFLCCGSLLRIDSKEAGENNLSVLDVSDCTALETLRCASNRLTELNLQNNKDLVYLKCESNQIETLDVSGFVALEKMNCASNQMREINVSGCEALLYLNCTSNALSQLETKDCILLERIDCASNGLQELDVSGNTALREIWCYSNQITQLDVRDNSSLSFMVIDENVEVQGASDGCMIYRQLVPDALNVDKTGHAWW